MDYKNCTKCGELKALTEFYKRSDNNTHRSHCKTCTRPKNRVGAAKWRAKNPESVKEQNLRFKTLNPDYSKEWYQANLVHARAKRRKYREDNLAVYAANTAKYRAAKLQRTPSWLTEEHWDQINSIYENCPPGYHVDHIVPLQGENVCGLHIPLNLRIIPAEDNLSKSNKLEGDSYGTEDSTRISN